MDWPKRGRKSRNGSEASVLAGQKLPALRCPFLILVISCGTLGYWCVCVCACACVCARVERAKEKHSTGEEDRWEDEVPEHPTRGRRAVSAAGLLGSGSRKGGVFFALVGMTPSVFPAASFSSARAGRKPGSASRLPGASLNLRSVRTLRIQHTGF